MRKQEFLDKMIKVRTRFEQKDSFVCHALGHVFDKDELSFKRDSKVTKLYKDIINGKDIRNSGMYLMPKHGTIRQQHRRNSIEIFEVVMLDEQLYRGL